LCGVKKHARTESEIAFSPETMFAALSSSPNAACSLTSRQNREGFGSVRVLRYKHKFVTRKKTPFTIENVTAKTALKEWAKTERAIERGEQVLLFRKGGINDAKDGGFQILANQFVIFPTSFHSSSRDEEAVPDMKKGESVPFSIVCRITSAWQTSEKSVIKSLEKFHCLREDEIISRVNYKPNEPYSILEVRAYVLPKGEFVLPADAEKYGGCKSWIEKLPFGIPDTTTLPPVLDQRDWWISQSDLKRKIEFLQATGVDIKELPI